MSVFAFSSTPELLFGLYLLYYFRVFERQIGSNKYSVSYPIAILFGISGVFWGKHKMYEYLFIVVAKTSYRELLK